MHITIEADATLPDHRLYVSADLDAELMATLEASRFEVRVDVAQPPLSIRMSVGLADRLDTWQTLQSVLPRNRHPLR
jgi:hypothetical protein